MQKAKIFNLFALFFLPLHLIYASAIARMRRMLENPQTSAIYKDAVAFGDAQILELFTIVGMAVITGGLDKTAALAYAIELVKAGGGVTPIIRAMRDFATIEVGEVGGDNHAQFRITPETTLEQFIEMMAEAAPFMKLQQAANRHMFAQSQREQFEKMRYNLIGQMDDYVRTEASADELAQIGTITEIDMPPKPRSKSKASDFIDMMLETLQQDGIIGNPPDNPRQN